MGTVSAAGCRNDPDVVIIEGEDAGFGQGAAPGSPPTRGLQPGNQPIGTPPIDDPDAVSPNDAGAGVQDGGVSTVPTDAPIVNPPRPEVAPGLSRGLIFYLPLDEGPTGDVQDTSVNANRVRLVAPDPAAATWVAGWRGMALRFNGVPRTELQVESSLSLDTIADGFTIALWYRRDNNNAQGTFLTRSAPMDRGCLYCADLVGDRLRLQINSPIMYRADLFTEVLVPTARWVHLAFTYDQVAGATQIFMDGNPVARGLYAHPIGPQIRPVIIGDGLTGTIDEITLHSRALSAAEVHALALGADPLR